METEDRLLKVGEAARMARVSPRTVRDHLRSGIIPGLVQIGPGYRVDEKLFVAWLRAGGSRRPL